MPKDPELINLEDELNNIAKSVYGHLPRQDQNMVLSLLLLAKILLRFLPEVKNEKT